MTNETTSDKIEKSCRNAPNKKRRFKMFQANKLKGKICEKGLTIATISQKIGMNATTFYRKLSKKSFSLMEVEKITTELKLTSDEARDIFFG